MKVIRLKLRKIWQNAVNITQTFDPKYGNLTKENEGYLYDPLKNTTENNCKNKQNRNCVDWWGQRRRSKDIAFTERKMLRLAFHDCFPYNNGGGGCDGCLNLNENLHDNNGLQFTIAVLEKLFMEKDFIDLSEFSPELKLEQSPKDLGISRADLWAFAGLVALDEVQSLTRKRCFVDEAGYTCDQTQCFLPFDQEQFETMFETGRVDCQPRNVDKFASQRGYLASEIGNNDR